MDIRVRFQFIDDQPKTMFFGLIPLESEKTRAEREKRHDLYSQAFEQQVVAGWSQQFDFQNIRAPQSVWGKLNPTKVRVNVQDVDRIKGGGKAGAHHWTIKVKLKSTGIAEVINASNLVKFYKGDDKASMAFNPSTAKGELKRVRRIAPSPIVFKNEKTEVKSAEAVENLRYFGTYLKRINNPQFKVAIVGHANATGKKDKNLQYSEERAQSVKDKIVAAGVGPHTVTAKGVGDSGATADGSWRKVTIGVDMAKTGWKNFQDVTLHEFGHMIGLDDEYTRKGDSRKFADHYILIKKAFGDKYAQEHSKIPGARTASVMYSGNDVRIHHYVTFWQALYETTKAKAPAPKERFGFKDWKFVE
jgi:outer membrane protein OmpA-like peptidoglycan-associated protein